MHTHDDDHRLDAAKGLEWLSAFSLHGDVMISIAGPNFSATFGVLHPAYAKKQLNISGECLIDVLAKTWQTRDDLLKSLDDPRDSEWTMGDTPPPSPDPSAN